MNNRKSKRRKEVSCNSSSSSSHQKKTSTINHKRNKPKRQKQITRSSNKTYFCSGCNLSFHQFNTPSQFIKLHMELSDKCKKHITYCENCGSTFINDRNLMSHLSKTNLPCRKFYDNKAKSKTKAESFSISQVSIVQRKSNVSNNDLCSINDCENIPLPTYQFLQSAVTKVTHQEFKNNRVRNIDCMPFNENNTFCLSVTDNSINESTILEDTCYIPETIIQQSNNVAESPIQIINENQSNIDEQGKSITYTSSVKAGLYSDDLLNHLSECDEDDDDHEVANIENTYINPIPIIDTNVNHSSIPVQDHICIQTNNHLLELKEKHEQEKSRISYDTQYVDSLELIKLFMKKKMSLTSYNDFMKWKFDKNLDSYYTYESLVKSAEHRVYGLFLTEKMKPNATNLICPTGRKLSLITYDIDAAIYDLLSDVHLNQPNNYIFQDGNETNPFLSHNKTVFDDIDQSVTYINTKKKMNIDENTDLLCPIALYLDETNLDTFSKLTLHPVVMTLLIYNRKSRNSSMSWRTIGYIPNFNEHFGNKRYTPEQKMCDYHYCLRYILNGIEKIQAIHHLKWQFCFTKYPNKVYNRNLRFYLSHVSGDAKGNDVWCGRFNNRTKTVCLARDCDVKVLDSDNPNVSCNFLSMYDLEKKLIQS